MSLLMLLPPAGVAMGAGDMTLRVGQPFERKVDAPLTLALPVAAGDYVVGRVEAAGAALDVDILGEDGAHHRRIADQQGGVIGFRFVAEAAGIRLRLAPAGAVALSVVIEEVVPVAEQRPPAAEYLSPRIAGLAAELAAGRGSEAFWREVAERGTPLIETRRMPGPFYPGAPARMREQTLMTFLWRGAQRNVRLVGGPSSDHAWLERLGASDVWFVTFPVPPATRLAYQLAPDIPDIPGDARVRRGAISATLQMDPFNRQPWPRQAPDRFNQQATVELAGAPTQPGTPAMPAADPLLCSFVFASETLGNSRRITVAHPRDLDPSDPNLVLAIIFDGERALHQIDVPGMLDTLTASGRLPPVVAVLVPSIDSGTRSRELPGNAAFADALADELLPRVAALTGIRPEAERTVLAGASYGGLAAATAALRRPDRFGNVLSMSGSFWWAPEGRDTDGTPFVGQSLAEAGKKPLRFFLSAGTFESGHGDVAGILESSRQVRDISRLKGYETHWREYAGGHDWLVWRGALADGLIALFGAVHEE
ncbi:enterochelin esterase [Stutzerimonas kirkiae]|nr:enterochelin esterase [Stutzerimonas kirkiae]